jgi:hypothetical protein
MSATELEYHLPHAEALVAGTLALMTAHAQATCEDDRAYMARKVLDNFAQLSSHTCISAQFRRVLRVLEEHWQALQALPGEEKPLQPTVAPTVH